MADGSALDKLSDAQKFARWLAVGDTGLSSKAIALRMCGIANGRYGICHPHDGDDFGRCHRLLLLYPEWRERLAAVMAPASPYWAALVARWDEIEAAYLRDLKTHQSGERSHTAYACYDLMRSILKPLEDAEERAALRARRDREKADG